MASVSRHQCLIYSGAPSRQLASLAAATRDKLNQRYRCLCLNTAPMIAGMRSYLAAAGVDVENVLAKGSLILSSEQTHLVNGHFELESMLGMLEMILHQALKDGYAGLFATGDMTWEMGPDRDYSRLLEYEWRLEEFFSEHPEISGICQYHAETLPASVMRRGVAVHRSFFVNETLSLLNPHAVDSQASVAGMEEDPELDALIARCCQRAAAGEPTEV